MCRCLRVIQACCKGLKWREAGRGGSAGCSSNSSDDDSNDGPLSDCLHRHCFEYPDPEPGHKEEQGPARKNHRWRKSSSRIPLTRCTSGLEPLEQIPTVFNPRERRMSYSNDSSDDEPTHCYWPPLTHPMPPCPPYSDFKPHLPQPPTRGTGEASPSSISPVQSSEDELPPPYITVSNTHPQPDGEVLAQQHASRRLARHHKPESPETPEEPIFANVQIGTTCLTDVYPEGRRGRRQGKALATGDIPKIPAPASPRSRARHLKGASFAVKAESVLCQDSQPTSGLKNRSSSKSQSECSKRSPEFSSRLSESNVLELTPPSEPAPSPPVSVSESVSLSPSRASTSCQPSSSLSPSHHSQPLSPIPSTSPSHSFCSSLTSVSPHHSSVVSPSHNNRYSAVSPSHCGLISSPSPSHRALLSSGSPSHLSLASGTTSPSHPGTTSITLSSSSPNPTTSDQTPSPSHYCTPLTASEATTVPQLPPLGPSSTGAAETRASEHTTAEGTLTPTADVVSCSGSSSYSSSGPPSRQVSSCGSESSLLPPSSPGRPALPPRGGTPRQAPERPSSSTKPAPSLPPRGAAAAAPPLPPSIVRRQQ